MPKYFDVHSHLNFPDQWDDFDAVLARLRTTETYTIAVGTDFESSRKAVELAGKYQEIYACVGMHPIDNLENFEAEKFDALMRSPKVVAVGECGLDFFHADQANDYERQRKLFADQIAFALAHDKPIMVHARDAYKKLLEMLEPMKKKYGARLRGNIHFFAGDTSMAERFFALGFTVSFTGVITFTHDYDEVIRVAPLDKIMSETDAPYVAPVPYRGQRNEPSYVSEVAKKIADIRGEDEETVKAALVNNALSMIG